MENERPEKSRRVKRGKEENKKAEDVRHPEPSEGKSCLATVVSDAPFNMTPQDSTESRRILRSNRNKKAETSSPTQVDSSEEDNPISSQLSSRN